jgi:ubiquinone/menaquinone biosynthesis C-methylase UbiE
MNTQDKYVHAMGHRALTPLYDPFVRYFMRERIFRGRLIDQLALHAGDRMLDVGCGTGTLAIWAKREFPRAEVTGVDGDADIIERARRKAAASGLDVRFQVSIATELPFADRSFDCMTNTFLMHHLPPLEKRRCFQESLRILRPGGRIHVVDFGPPRGRLARALMEPLRRMAWLADNLDGRLPGMLSDAGFLEVRETGRVATAFGPAVFLVATRAPS